MLIKEKVEIKNPIKKISLIGLALNEVTASKDNDRRFRVKKKINSPRWFI